jgi:hypothetical protein
MHHLTAYSWTRNVADRDISLYSSALEAHNILKDEAIHQSSWTEYDKGRRSSTSNTDPV